jgi:hypothetical protein
MILETMVEEKEKKNRQFFCLLTKGALRLMGSQIHRYRQMAEDSDKLQCVVI